MKQIAFCTFIFLVTINIVPLLCADPKPSNKKFVAIRCAKSRNGQQICICGKEKVNFYPKLGERCVNGKVTRSSKSELSDLRNPYSVLRLTATPLTRSTRDADRAISCSRLIIQNTTKPSFVPLLNVSVEAWVDTFSADVTLKQVFINREENPIEAVYVFPIEENAAVYSFTAQIDDRTITAVLKEKKTAEKEYDEALSKGQMAVMMRQSQDTLDTFTVNVGSLPPGKQCHVTIKYVTELDLIEEKSIRFVVPTTIAPRYNPSLGHLQSPDNTGAEYVQKTSYSMKFLAHLSRHDNFLITQVANLTHPVNVSTTKESIDISTEPLTLDRDIILDIDLPEKRAPVVVSLGKSANSNDHSVLLSFVPRLSDFMKISHGHNETNTEFIFIVDCSGSMSSYNGIELAREAMLLFIRSLPVGSRFNIIRFGSHYEILFQNEETTVVYQENTAKKAETLTKSMGADLGGTELLEPLEYLQKHPPLSGRTRQIFLLTDGEISNTNQVIDLCRSMASHTRIFSFGLGSSPSRSLVKGLARATNGYFVFVPPNSKVDTYVGSQLGRALQPSIINARLQWNGLTTDHSQSPKTVPPLYIGDRVLIYETIKNLPTTNEISVDLMVGEHQFGTIKLPNQPTGKQDAISRLAAKALIQEIQHEKNNTNNENDKSIEQRITELSLAHQILSPYTAFIGVESDGPTVDSSKTKVRHVPIQIAKDHEHLFAQPSMMYRGYGGFMGGHIRGVMHGPPMASYAMSAPMGPPGMRMGPSSRNSMAQQTFYHKAVKPPFMTSSPNYQADQLDNAEKDGDSSTTLAPFTGGDTVRWLINRQSFNGAWVLNENDVSKLTNGKSLNSMTFSVSYPRDALTTALAIALLESKHADQKTLWFAIVDKARKQLYSSGLTAAQVNALLDEIKKQL